MNRFILAAIVPVLLCAAQPVLAQSALKRLEDLIRSQRTGAPSDAPAPTEQNAAPADRQPAEQSSEKPSREPGYLGVVADDRQDRGRGVRIVAVRPGSPAEKAGLKVQDLVTAVGGIRVRQMDDMAAILDQMAPGDSLDFEVLRANAPHKLEVTFGTRGHPKTGTFEKVVTPSPEPDEKPQSDRALIEKLQRRIAELERRVQALERLLK